jgi:hypothetical protein
MAEEANRVAEVNPEVHDSALPAETEPEHPGVDGADVPQAVSGQELPPELQPDKDGNPPQLTEALFRKLRGRYFTVKHPELACGHKLDLINFPKRNCQDCLFHFFNTHPQLVETADKFYREHGKGPLVAMRGEKFFKAFVRYMVTIIKIAQEQKAREDNGVIGQESASGASGTSSSTDGAGESSEAPAVTEG